MGQPKDDRQYKPLVVEEKATPATIKKAAQRQLHPNEECLVTRKLELNAECYQSVQAPVTSGLTGDSSVHNRSPSVINPYRITNHKGKVLNNYWSTTISVTGRIDSIINHGMGTIISIQLEQKCKSNSNIPQVESA